MCFPEGSMDWLIGATSASHTLAQNSAAATAAAHLDEILSSLKKSRY